MRLIVSTNWDDKFLDGLNPEIVKWVSGRLPQDAVGSSSVLACNMLKRINRSGIEKYIKKVHKRKIKFNYLLDGSCTGNKEYSWAGADKIREIITWISDSGADGVTVVLPHLVQIIKKDYPGLRVGFGGARVIWELTRVKYFDSLGVDWVILNEGTNRSFRMLKALRNAVKCELWLIANSGCLLFCNFGFDHDNYLAHASNFSAPHVYSNYFHSNCYKTMLENPQELVKIPWIRPEDTALYESIGFDQFIINANTPNTEELLNIVYSYEDRHYEGNLFDILSAMGKKICHNGNSRNDEGAPYLDNKQLDNFLDFFVKKPQDCANMLCSECGYCKDAAKRKVVFRSKQKRNKLIKKYQIEIERMENGK